MIEFTVAVACAYLYGSLPTGYLAGKMRGKDIRREGSGSTGATNVFRQLGAGPGIAVAAVDISKGMIPAVLGKYALGMEDFYVLAVVFSGGLVQVFPVFLGFKGGKGVSVLLGGLIIIAWHPVVVPAAATMWLAMLVSIRIMSLVNLMAFLLLVAPALYICQDFSLAWYLAGLGLFMFVCVTHRENIGRLLRGTEKRLNY